MTRKWFYAFAGVLVLALVGGPVAAHDFTGHEEDEVEFDCPDEGGQVPDGQPEPGPDDCGAGDETYTATVWNNQVTCGDDEVADLQIGKLYAAGDPDDLEGGIGVCNDGDTGPLQGRIVVGGSMEQGGIHAYADGTDENEPDQAQGWARVDVTPDGPEVRCGADDGRRDASHPEDGDTMDNCG